MPAHRRLRLAICGGGPGGLSLAVVLGKYGADVDIDLYEALPHFTEIGAGISVWKRTWFIIKSLGLDEALGRMAVRPPEDVIKPGFILRKSNQSKGFDFFQMIMPYGSITLHRRDMLKVLTDNLPSSERFTPHFNKRLASYKHVHHLDGIRSVILYFEDGSTAQADLLVGADGIKSVTRATMFEDIAKRRGNETLLKHIKPSWSGTYGYRCLVDTKRFLKEVGKNEHTFASEALFYCGSDRHLVSYPISQGTLINIVAFVTIPEGEGKEYGGPVVIDVPKKELLDQYKGWETDLLTLLNSAESVSRWAIFQVRNLPTFIDGRVCLLGDSANGMTTHLGAGAGQAIEGAYIIGRLIASLTLVPSLPDFSTIQDLIPSVLKAYDAVRRPFAMHVVETSRKTGFLYEFSEPNSVVPGDGPMPLPDRALLERGDEEALTKLGERCLSNWSLQWTQMPDVEYKKAETILREELESWLPSTRSTVLSKL